jgi:glyoxylase-like metal-dependent hydrolase (beta-lactamase superfamily II)
MRIANGIEMLEIEANLTQGPGIIHPVLIWDDNEVILVDTGFPGQFPQFAEAIQKAGVSIERLTKVIITHHDLDHIGGLSGLLKHSPQKIELLAHRMEKPYIEGEQLPTKMPRTDTISQEQLEKMKIIYGNKLDRALIDGEELPYCGGIIVIHTPGHTPGHICLFLKKEKTLITGDAMSVVDHQLLGPAPRFTYDMNLAMDSLGKLKNYDIEKVICYHGGLYQGQIRQRIDEIIQS